MAIRVGCAILFAMNLVGCRSTQQASNSPTGRARITAADEQRDLRADRRAAPDPTIQLVSKQHEQGGKGAVLPKHSAPQASEMTLDGLESLAWSNNPTLVQAQAQVGAARGKALQAGLYPNPKLSYVGEQIGVMGTPGEWQGGELQQEIVTAGKLRLSRSKHAARASVAEALRIAQQYRVLNDVRTHFYGAWGAQQIVGIRGELLKTAEDRLVTVREKFNVGQANAADVALAKAALAEAKLELKMAENAARAEWKMLTSVIGCRIPPMSLIADLKGDTTPLDWDAAYADIVAHSPQLVMAERKVRADEITVERERVEPIPNVVILGGVGRNFEARETTYNAGAMISVPIFDRNQGTIRQAENDLVRARSEVRRTELKLRRMLAERYRHYLTALQHVTRFEKTILPETRKAYEARLRAYKQNRETWSNVLEAQQKYFGRRMQYIEHLVRWRSEEAVIKGYLLTDGLMAPQGPMPPGHIDAVPKPR